MRVETRVLEHESTVRGERVAMSIDESALSHIMSVLTDLYSDPELAVIREYATNAADANREAGSTAPIEVTLPSALAPFFTVRDSGVGLDAGDIRDVFSRYGTSTKRETNDAVGMLGLGCKSALTYTDQFTLTSTKAGRTVQVLVSRDEDGAGSMSIVSDEPAGTSATGTTVTVPAKRANSFVEKARSFFRFWPTGSVLIDGEEPARIDGLWLTPNLLYTREVHGTDYVVMGGVPYPAAIASRDGGYVPHGAHRIVAFVDIGTLTFTPSREALQDTKRTRETLARIAADVERERDASVRRQVENAKSPADAVRLLQEGRAIGFKGEVKYRGHDVPAALDRRPIGADGARSRFAAVPDNPAASFLRAGTRYGKVNGERTLTIPLGEPMTFFQGFAAKQLSPTKREKLSVWADGKGLTLGALVFVERYSRTERFWLDGATIYEWDEVEAIKLDRATATVPGGSTKPRGAYDAFDTGTFGLVQAADIDTSRPLYWLWGNRSTVDNHEAIRRGVVRLEDCTVVALPENRIAKFRRDFPTAVELNEAAGAIARKWEKGIDGEARKAHALQSRWAGACRLLAKLDPAKVNDPALRRAIALATKDVREHRTAAAKFGQWLKLDAYREGGDVSPLAKYPLLDGDGGGYHSRPPVEHATLYVNAAYAAEREG